MGHEYKVGDLVRVVDTVCGHGFNVGDIVCVEEVSSNYKCRRGDEYWFLVDREIEPYIEPTTGTPTSADAFRMIHEALYAGVDAMLDDCDYETALKYAAMMHAIEQFTPKPTT